MTSFSLDALFSRAKSHERAGALPEAARCYADILARFPVNRRARAALTALEARSDEAVRGHAPLLRRMIAAGQGQQARQMAEHLAGGLAPTVPLLLLLAEARLAAGDAGAAVATLEMAVQRPGGGAARLLLGTALHRLGRGAEAVAVLRTALEETPENHAARMNLAIALGAAGEAEAALAECRRAMAHLPEGPELHLTHGNLLRQTGDPVGAEEAYAAALRLRPEDPPVLHNLAGALLEQERAAEALALYDRLLALPLPEAPNRLGRARALARLGRVEDARAAFARCAELMPGEVAPQLELGHLLRETGDAAGAARGYLAGLEIAPERGVLWEGLALAHDFTPGDPLIGRMRAALTGAGADQDGCGLYFALARAADRTGDTEAAFAHYAAGNRIRRALLRHDPGADRRRFDALARGFAVAPAPPEAARLPGAVPVFVLGMPRSGTTLVEQILAAHPQVRAAGELPTLHLAMRRHLRTTLDTGAAPAPGALAALRAEYLAHIDRIGGGAAVVTDKTPTNFLWLGGILAALPEARILHLARDPMAVGWSCFTTNFRGAGQGFACDLGDTGRYIRAHDALMAQWHRLWPGRIHEIDYEALARDPEPGIRGIVAAAGLDWAPECLDFHRVERRVATASALQVRRGVYRDADAAWRRYADHLGPLRAALAG